MCQLPEMFLAHHLSFQSTQNLWNPCRAPQMAGRGLFFNVCVHMLMHTHAQIWRPEDHLRWHPQGHCLLPLRQSLSLAWSLPVRLAWLTSHSQGFLSLYPQFWGSKHTPPRLTFFCEFWGANLSPPHLREKHSTQ